MSTNTHSAEHQKPEKNMGRVVHPMPTDGEDRFLTYLFEENDAVFVHLVLLENAVIRGDGERHIINASSSLLEGSSTSAFLVL